jgi:hypothetical protein
MIKHKIVYFMFLYSHGLSFECLYGKKWSNSSPLEQISPPFDKLISGGSSGE